MKNIRPLLSFLLFSGIIVVFVAAKSTKTQLIKFGKDKLVITEVFFDRLYAAETEVTNLQYSTFLKELKSEGKIELYNSCLYDSTQWTKKFPKSYMSPMEENYHWHPAYAHYPLVNISHNSANEYCKWLTEKYMKLDKKPYRKVIFRLPSEAEWNTACAPLIDNNLPWYGKYAYNQKCEFLANVKFKNYSKQKSVDYTADGGISTLIVGHYKPSGNGFYDMIGNVAEMISENGIQKGGSWDNYIDECGVDKAQNYTNPDPRVGFRVFMQVIEK